MISAPPSTPSLQDGRPLSADDHYWGLYLAMEKIERGKDRVDVAALSVESVGAANEYNAEAEVTGRSQCWA